MKHKVRLNVVIDRVRHARRLSQASSGSHVSSQPRRVVVLVMPLPSLGVPRGQGVRVRHASDIFYYGQ